MKPADIQTVLSYTLSGHQAGVYALAAEPDADKFYSGAGDGLVAAWQPDTREDGEAVARVKGNIFCLWRIEHSPYLIAGDMLGNAHQLNIDMQAETASLSTNGHAIYDISPYEELAILGCGNGYLHKIAPGSFEILSSVQIGERHFRKLLLHQDVLLAGCSDNNIYCISPDNWEVQEVLRGHTGSVFSLTYNHHAGHYLSGAMDAQIRVWSTELRPLANLEAHLYTVNDMAVHPTVPIFATASRDKTIKIWDAHSYTLLKVLTHEKYNGHTHSVNKIFWSSVHGHLISCSDDRTIKVWEININV